MSSFKIIRKGGLEQRLFALGPLGNLQPSGDEEAFRPVRLGGEEPPQVEEEAPPPPPCIPEEEALRRIQQAHADGVKKGRQQAEADLAKVSEALAQALLATGSLRAQLMHEAEEDLLRLSVQIAGKVLMRELSIDPGILAGLVQGAVALAADEGEILVRLNPEEYAAVAFRPEFQALSGDRRRITLKGDAAVAPAGCVVETARGNIDAGVEAQLEEILRRLTEVRSARQEEQGD
ncbi:MAG TPA: flagellar assembly protein FliH [Geobacter sp.]|nr:flagellar assembly protein FliH [Geobacter sp.]